MSIILKVSTMAALLVLVVGLKTSDVKADQSRLVLPEYSA